MTTRRPARITKASFLLLVVALCAACSHGPAPSPDESTSFRPEPPDMPTGPAAEPPVPLRYPDLVDDPETAEREDYTDPLVEELLSSLTMRQRIGQRFITHVPGTRLSYGAGRAIVEVAPAGFILYPWNFDTGDDVRALTSSLDSFARFVTPGIGLLMCADQEGGRVRTFRFPEFVSLPSAATLGSLAETSGMDLIEASAFINGLQMRDLGLNMNLAPVLDVFDGEATTIIGDRSFSGNPQTVSRAAIAYLAGARRSGIISVAKHFPGHGITTVDSHRELPVVTDSAEEIRTVHLPPFVAAIKAGVGAIMTSHVLYESIDPYYPATLSRVFLREILRDELQFNGVVISDGFEMGALRDNYDMRETLVRMFRNDVDLILLFVSDDVVDIVDQVEELIAAGEITREDVDRGVRRVLRMKIENGIAGRFR